LDTVRLWLDRGIDGFRLDVFNAYFKRYDFPDNPFCLGIRGFDRQKHIYDIDQPEMMPLLAELRSLLDQYPQRYAIGETFLSTPEKAASYVGENALHAAFDFTLLEAGWNPQKILTTIRRWETALGPRKWPNYVLNNHDVPRIATRYHFDEQDNRSKVAAALLLTLRGTPFLYAGEEIGMRDIKLKRNEILDPPGKKYWPIYKGRDGCRSPMQWNSSVNAGFSKAKPWLPVHPNFSYRNVNAQSADEESLLNFYRKLIFLRKSTSALRNGSFTVVPQVSSNVLVYLRQDEANQMLVALNFSRSNQLISLPQDQSTGWKLELSSRRKTMETMNGSMRLIPDEALILQKVVHHNPDC
jgi:alpha-glucosidase